MRLLDRTHKVSTRFGGGFVQTIGDTAKGRDARTAAQSTGSSTSTARAVRRGARRRSYPRAGDRVWWDLHDWAATPDVNAVVGSFPEPFLHGARGRSPTGAPGVRAGRDERLRDRRRAAEGDRCRTYPPGRHRDGGDPARRPGARRAVARTAGRHPPHGGLERGPAASGVFARPASGGGSIAVLDARGAVCPHPARPAPGSSPRPRRPAAPRPGSSPGTDARGVARAAAALTEQALDARFAVGRGAGRDTGGAGSVRFAAADSPLHAARASVAVTWCCRAGHAGDRLRPSARPGRGPRRRRPCAGLLAGVRRELWASARIGLVVAITWAIVNPFVARQGLTVLLRFGEIPPVRSDRPHVQRP